MKIKNLLKSLAEKTSNHKRYIFNELKHQFQKGGDQRDAFTKKVHKCHYLEFTDIIHNAG